MDEKFGKPQLGHSQGHEDLSNTERRLVSMLTQTEEKNENVWILSATPPKSS